MSPTDILNAQLAFLARAIDTLNAALDSAMHLAAS